ncbi:MAG: imidazoleglycerol-phosphate dehydratase HisB [Methylocystaceae bacterium]
MSTGLGGRQAEIKRKTLETEILVNLDLDGVGQYQIDTEVGFLSHMLSLLSAHSMMNLKVWARGDTEVDYHHTVEDIGICIGEAIKSALGDMRGITRYGSAYVPMDEALVRVVIDLSGRSFVVMAGDLPGTQVGNFPTELVEDFFQALANHTGMNLHIDIIRGRNSHHVIEAIFKAFARALRQASRIEPGMEDVWSTKGKL